MKLKVDAVVFSVNPHGFFCQAGPLQLFVSNFVRAASDLTARLLVWACRWRLTMFQLMPKTCKYDANATPPQFTDHEGLTIESGSHVRVKIAGIRNEVGEIRAIGSINEDYLGYGIGPACSIFDSLLMTATTDLYKTKTLRTRRLEKIMWVRAIVTELGKKPNVHLRGSSHGRGLFADELSGYGATGQNSL